MDENTRNTIIHHWHLGQSQRQIARGLHVSRNTVKAVLDEVHRARNGSAPAVESRQPPRRKRSLLDDYEEQIVQLLTRFPYITIVDLLNRLQASGYQGSYTILRERVKRLRQTTLRRAHLEAASIAYAGSIRTTRCSVELAAGTQQLRLMVFQLKYSGRISISFNSTIDLAVMLFRHARAFEEVGGVPVVIYYDRSVDSLADMGAESPPRFNPVFMRFANHYGFRPCWEEEPVPDESNHRLLLLDRLRSQLISGRQYRSIAHLNDATQRWLTEMEHQLIYRGRRPMDWYADELEHLVPLPSHAWRG